ncbi:hypothetical protein PoB_007443600 [Plakobranchus ocellatus]|uniref:Uncharacterized protein n=1 Tax=Plakobranchus ocellatus TaxID=259542 RepID=A0AAV4DV04_9GAST|nr:hypothetical protein PoB_007443600 [Plakobranchus ocellatus]
MAGFQAGRPATGHGQSLIESLEGKLTERGSARQGAWQTKFGVRVRWKELSKILGTDMGQNTLRGLAQLILLVYTHWSRLTGSDVAQWPRESCGGC